MSSPSQNPYENLYRSMITESQKNSSKKDIEDLARHVGFLHNTLGLATKELILTISKSEENNHDW